MARDRPSPYGEGTFFPVARGPVPRDLHCQDALLGPLGPDTVKKGCVPPPVARGPVPRDRHCQDTILGPLGPEENKRRFFRSRTMARDRPSPYGEGEAFFFVVRGPVPRDLHCQDALLGVL